MTSAERHSLADHKKNDPIRVMEGIRWWFRVLVVCTAIIFLISVGTAVYAAVQASVQHQAVCALQDDLERRIRSANDFLKEHPEGLANVPPATLRESIRNQERTLTALSIVRCG